MSSRSVIVHFPDGSREFRYPDQPLEEGDTIWHEGERYTVIRVAEDGSRSSVTVQQLDSDGAAGAAGSEDGIHLAPLEA